MARSNADVATWASEVQRTVLFLPKFESEADGAKGVKFRNDDDTSLSRHLHHFRYLCSAVRLSLAVASKSSTKQLISLAGIQTAEGNLHFFPYPLMVSPNNVLGKFGEPFALKLEAAITAGEPPAKDIQLDPAHDLQQELQGRRRYEGSRSVD